MKNKSERFELHNVWSFTIFCCVLVISISSCTVFTVNKRINGDAKELQSTIENIKTCVDKFDGKHWRTSKDSFECYDKDWDSVWLYNVH